METLNAIERLDEVIAGLNAAERTRFTELGYTHAPDVWHAKDKAKFIHINCGGSGAFMLEKATGELFNIKAYGVADRNKKLKADIGNIATVDPAKLHAQRYNYLR